MINQALDPAIESVIERLNRQPYLELPQVKNCHDWMYELVLSKMTGLLVGESRCGKTVSCKVFATNYNKLKQGKGTRTLPVVYIQIPKNCGSRDFFIKILKVLNRPTNGNTTDLRERALDSLAIHQVEMLIIDEANHLKHDTFADVRHVYDEDTLNMAVLLVGTTHRLEAVVKRDDQVANRFLEEYELDRIEDKDFKTLVQVWERDVLALPEPSNLHKAESLKLLSTSTQKLIGRLDMILRKAAIRSLLKGHQHIPTDILKQVVSATNWTHGKQRF